MSILGALFPERAPGRISPSRHTTGMGEGLAPTPIPRATTMEGRPQWAPIGVIPAWQQIGRYDQPPQTQIPGNYPGVQLKCGVEGIRPWFYVPTQADVPYFQQTNRNVQDMTLSDGRRPGAQLGPAQVSALLGPQRQIAAEQLQAVANGIMGW